MDNPRSAKYAVCCGVPVVRLLIDGKHKNVSNKELRSAAHYYARQLFTKQTNKKLTVTIEFDNIGAPEDNGFCEYADRKDRPRAFVIGIRRNLSRSTALKTLAHEMVHAWQYARGHLYDLEMGNGVEGTKWRGRKFSSNSTNYWDAPWEIDAFGREVGLYHRYATWKWLRGEYVKRRKAAEKRLRSKR